MVFSCWVPGGRQDAGKLDNYIGMPQNYDLLLDKTDQKLRIRPWDLNETCGTFTMGREPETLA